MRWTCWGYFLEFFLRVCVSRLCAHVPFSRRAVVLVRPWLGSWLATIWGTRCSYDLKQTTDHSSVPNCNRKSSFYVPEMGIILSRLNVDVSQVVSKISTYFTNCLGWSVSGLCSFYIGQELHEGLTRVSSPIVPRNLEGVMIVFIDFSVVILLCRVPVHTSERDQRG